MKFHLFIYPPTFEQISVTFNSKINVAKVYTQNQLTEVSTHWTHHTMHQYIMDNL